VVFREAFDPQGRLVVDQELSHDVGEDLTQFPREVRGRSPQKVDEIDETRVGEGMAHANLLLTREPICSAETGVELKDAEVLEKDGAAIS
jgi:hypothetical protein